MLDTALRVNYCETRCEKRSGCLKSTDHPDRGSEDTNKPRKQAQRADRHPAGHALNAAGHHE
jgi:hypothetical protein